MTAELDTKQNMILVEYKHNTAATLHNTASTTSTCHWQPSQWVNHTTEYYINEKAVLALATISIILQNTTSTTSQPYHLQLF